MAKYILLYNGPATPPEQMGEEQTKAEMQKWQVWMQKVGKAMVDMGLPMANGTAVLDDGTVGKATQLNGYSIIEASDAEAAKKLVEGHPFLSEGKGKFSVEIHELLPMPM